MEIQKEFCPGKSPVDALEVIAHAILLSVAIVKQFNPIVCTSLE